MEFYLHISGCCVCVRLEELEVALGMLQERSGLLWWMRRFSGGCSSTCVVTTRINETLGVCASVSLQSCCDFYSHSNDVDLKPWLVKLDAEKSSFRDGEWMNEWMDDEWPVLPGLRTSGHMVGIAAYKQRSAAIVCWGWNSLTFFCFPNCGNRVTR